MAEQTDDLLEHIEQAAQEPKRVTGDQGTVEQHSLAEQIEADKYARSLRSASSGIGIRFRKIIPPNSD